MHPASRERILAELPDEALVLDVGGWAKPLSRANWVIDLMPYETRGMYGEPDPDPERFDESTWVTRDMCAREPWPFADDQFDFAVCSHTLEDVRDPVWVCEEMCRVARAGYVEVPARIEEQARGIHGDWVGWSHHHWLVDIDDGAIQFVFKTAVLQGEAELTISAELARHLTAEERVQTLWWESGFEARERVFLGAGEIEGYLAAGVDGWRDRLMERAGPPRQPKRRWWR
jgi:SAM-dependent methyltransferase